MSLGHMELSLGEGGGNKKKALDMAASLPVSSRGPAQDNKRYEGLRTGLSAGHLAGSSPQQWGQNMRRHCWDPRCLCGGNAMGRNRIEQRVQNWVPGNERGTNVMIGKTGNQPVDNMGPGGGSGVRGSTPSPGSRTGKVTGSHHVTCECK